MAAPDWQPVYSPERADETSFLQSLLESKKIPCFIANDRMGHRPLIGRPVPELGSWICVPKSDAVRAQRIIKRWLRTKKKNVPLPAEWKWDRQLFAYALLGMLVLWAILLVMLVVA